MQGLLMERAPERDSLFYTTSAGRWFLNRGTRGETITPRCPPGNPSPVQPRRTLPDPDDRTPLPSPLRRSSLVPRPSPLVPRPSSLVPRPCPTASPAAAGGAG